MSTATLPTLPVLPAAGSRSWRPSPYLHVGDDRIYNPHTDTTLLEGETGYDLLRRLVGDEQDLDPAADPFSEPVFEELKRRGWLVDADPDRRFHLKYVSLEAHTVCNQACYFCPVSVAPRKTEFMPDDLYERIVGEIAELGEPIEAVFMISYNEPTVDPRFVDQVRTIRRAGLPPATLTNGTGLTPERVDALVELGGLRFLSINLSTLDRQRYRRDRGNDHLGQVLRNLDYAKDKPVGEDMHIVVLGTDDETHHRDYAEISDRFAGSRFEVQFFVVNDRAGYLEVGLKSDGADLQLCGCDYMGSRPIQHLHINPRGECFLCCQDYNESVVVGDLRTASVRDVLESDAFARVRRQVYGLEESPDDFICRGCKYALRR